MTRDQAMWWLNHLFEIRKEEYFNKGMMEDAKEVEEAQRMAIEALQAEPRLVSRWIDADLDHDFAKCKNCSEHEVDIAYSKDFIKQERWNYCPYCGADMRGEQDE